ncbi:Beta-tubulin folding cofactor D [Pseudoloma neurophilia]|uniref:Beta-tubulin folding cofactor D n=1 Tax=Pseudoloma neurophilia TaxID=146866 RepID=A0A0R0M3G2_9MICR|nr:Beta-tubulin folding cofactor D [Pseudoloma neurophilia]
MYKTVLDILTAKNENHYIEFPTDIRYLYELHDYITKLDDLDKLHGLTIDWLKILLLNPFDLSSLKTPKFCSVILRDHKCAGYFIANLIKNDKKRMDEKMSKKESTNLLFSEEPKEYFKNGNILGKTVDRMFYFKTIRVVSALAPIPEFQDHLSDSLLDLSLSQVSFHSSEHSEKVLMTKLKKFVDEGPFDYNILIIKYEIITQQCKNGYINPQTCLNYFFSNLNQKISTAYYMAEAISQLPVNPETIYQYFEQDIFCRESLWANSLLVLGLLVYKQKLSAEAPKLLKIIEKTILIETTSVKIVDVRENCLFLVYCITQIIIFHPNKLKNKNELLNILEKRLVNSCLFDIFLECRRAAATILIELKANGLIKTYNFVDLIGVKRKRNILKVPKNEFDLIKDCIYNKIFSLDLEMQIVCLEWLKLNDIKIDLKKVGKNVEYCITDLLDIEISQNIVTTPIYYITALIVYTFLDQLDKIEVLFTKYMFLDPKAEFFFDFILKKASYSNYPFHGTNEFYEMVSNVYDESKVCNYLRFDIPSNVLTKENILLLLKNRKCPILTMTHVHLFDESEIYKELISSRSESFFYLNCSNKKYKTEVLQLITEELQEMKPVERKVIGMRCLFLLRYCNMSDPVFHRKITRLYHQAIMENLDNYQTDKSKDIGFICRLEAYFALIYCKDKKLNIYTIKFLFDCSKYIRDLIIAYLREIKVFKYVESFKSLYFTDLDLNETATIHHKMSFRLYKPKMGVYTLEINQNQYDSSSTISYNDHDQYLSPQFIRKQVFEDNVIQFLENLDLESEELLEDRSREQAMFEAAQHNSRYLAKPYKCHLAMGVFSNTLVSDRSLHDILMDWSGQLCHLIPKIYKTSHRNKFLCLEVYYQLLTHFGLDLDDDLYEFFLKMEDTPFPQIREKIINMYQDLLEEEQQREFS